MPDSIRVSIVIPAYNHANHLEMAINSVLYQDYDNIELIVLDDGSSDDTPEVLNKYNGRFYWESQPNMGQAATLNKGWQMSSGDILSYLSADDVLSKSAVSISVQVLENHPDVVLTYGDFNLIDAHDSVIRRVNAPEFNYACMVIEQACPPGPGVFFRRDAFVSAGLWDDQFKQIPDYEYWLRLGLIGDFKRIPRTLASFRVHPKSLTFSKADLPRAKEPIKAIEKYFRRNDVPDILVNQKPAALSNANLMSAQLHLRSGRYLLGYYYLKKSIYLYPKNILKSKSLHRISSGFFNRMFYHSIFLFNQIKKVIVQILTKTKMTRP